MLWLWARNGAMRARVSLSDWLSERADIICRFKASHNAGHTLVIDGKVYKQCAALGVVRVEAECHWQWRGA